jgi:hypothetical protein
VLAGARGSDRGARVQVGRDADVYDLAARFRDRPLDVVEPGGNPVRARERLGLRGAS